MSHVPHHITFNIQTNGQGLIEFTGDVETFVSASKTDSGLLTLFVCHTSCSLIIQEHAAVDVQKYLQDFFS
ncbi:MAG: YjbQ family protein, partial [Rhizobiaceae bacterium]|nr:YjbQ family protein [Rhizobiaceae bacterium]